MDSRTGLAWFSSLLIHPLLQEAQTRFTRNLGLDARHMPSFRPPRSASIHALSETGKRFISHTGQASSVVFAFLLQNIHMRIVSPLIPNLDSRQ